jgi:hypothetical protein
MAVADCVVCWFCCDMMTYNVESGTSTLCIGHPHVDLGRVDTCISSGSTMIETYERWIGDMVFTWFSSSRFFGTRTEILLNNLFSSSENESVLNCLQQLFMRFFFLFGSYLFSLFYSAFHYFFPSLNFILFHASLILHTFLLSQCDRMGCDTV